MRKYSYKIFITILWSFLTLMTLIPIYWMVLVSTKTPVELFGKPDLSPTFFDKIYWKNYTRPFIDGVYSEYLLNSVVIATSNAVLVTILALMATYALSRIKLAAAENIFFWWGWAGWYFLRLLAFLRNASSRWRTRRDPNTWTPNHRPHAHESFTRRR